MSDEPSTETDQSSGDTERRVQQLEDRVRELERIINQELGYNLGERSLEPQYVDCDCGETFQVNVENGLVCPHCGRGSDERGGCDA